MSESIRKALIAIGIIAGLALLCGGWLYWERVSKPVIDPIAEKEKDFASDSDDDYVIQTEARKAALDFAKNSLPTWTVKGVSCAAYGSNVFNAALDLEKDSQGIVLLVTERKFFRADGEPYWKVVADDPAQLERLQKGNPKPSPSISPSPLFSR